MLCPGDMFMWKMLIKYDLTITRLWTNPRGRTANIKNKRSLKETTGLDLTMKRQLDNVMLLSDDASNYVFDISICSNIMQKRNLLPTT